MMSAGHGGGEAPGPQSAAPTTAGGFRMAELLGAFSVASSLATGLPGEHGVRSCYMGLQIAQELGLPSEEIQDLYWTELLKDAGCTCWTSPIAVAILGDEIVARRELLWGGDPRNPGHMLGWIVQYMAAGAPLPTRISRAADFFVGGQSFWREGFYGACQVAGRIAQRLGMSQRVQNALLSVFEQWDGGGMPTGARGESIPVISRIVYATSFLEVFHQVGGRDTASRLARKRRGKAFDPAVVDAFLSLAGKDHFWSSLERESLWDTVLACEPQTPFLQVTEDQSEGVALAMADFADLKSPHSASHSRAVADAAGGIASRMRLPASEVTTIRRAALVHDIGLVAIPSFVLNKPDTHLSETEKEKLRLHPYHGERILSRVPALSAVASIVGYHHERPDGQGYYRRVAGSAIPLGARIVGAADAFCELTSGTPEQPGVEPEQALDLMRGQVGRAYDAGAFASLVAHVRGLPRKGRRQGGGWPAGLTDREVEVLRLLCRGSSRKDIAEVLVLSESTVRHHLEHIYAKVGVSSRASAALFAMEQGLLTD